MQAWADQHPDTEVIVQAGEHDFISSTMKVHKSLDQQEFVKLIATCEVFISHAGMGNIITALELGTPLLIVPRRATLGEHRNDHQIDTAERFGKYPGVAVATDLPELMAQVDSLRHGSRSASAEASPEKEKLLNAVRSFVST
ncbi:glycosyltransferase [Stenotrophomonas sp. ESTM1D_MKCIP4_1]|uniref:glycosyltransferase n=1 Tax=Stenotrophomonas sp. ESTM1D_MKCIP4_1 TaxID=2072414 RepID=UPI0020B16AFC|nr:glycosyltransferase [Stenotrophomonas sp. ESTM1D_MKCIP4_1]